MEETTQGISKYLEDFKAKQENEMNKVISQLKMLESRINKLEKENTILIKEINQSKISKFEDQILSSLVNKNFNTFKNIVERENYPLEEYFKNEEVRLYKLVFKF